jgi:FkbM family methyltransferase
MCDLFEVEKDMIFDIGGHRGDDTEVYLTLGFKVITVDANPAMILHMKDRFRNALIAGQLILLNYAITKEDGTDVSLFLTGDDSQSSIIRPSNKAVNVKSRTLGTLINEFGTPYYCKIDIEGCDHLAIASLNEGVCPPFISVEISGYSLEGIIEDKEKVFITLDHLVKKGYTRFKLVDQESLITMGASSFYKHNLHLVQRIRNKISRSFSLDYRSKFLAKFKLTSSSEISGYPGFLLPGDWIGYDEMKRRIMFHFSEYYLVASSRNLIFWVDIHATF